jgi:predicted acetylornithine/succinylornithine family transaminase
MTAPTAQVADRLLGVYRMPDVLFVRGEGVELIDDAGKHYLDFTSGIGVNALGHGSPVVRRAIERALETGLIHVSNLFRTAPAGALAEFLTDRAGLDRAFFCNSGAESIEGALKFSRKWAKARGGPEKHRVVALKGSFHGRLFGSLAVTDRPGYREPYEPLMPGVDFVDPADLTAVDHALSRERTAALVLEPIQGEVGVRPLSTAFLETIRKWTSEREIALVLDEVQCGLGRAGTFFAHEPSGIRPDVVCIAKPLGGGLPMGAVLMSEDIASQLQPGDHGTTFGGGPLISSVALAVLRVVGDPSFLAAVRSKGSTLGARLEAIAAGRKGRIKEVRGRGLIWGVEMSEPVAPHVARALELGLLIVPAGPTVLRFLPPLIVSDEEIDRASSILEEVLA